MPHSQGLSNNPYPELKQTQFPALIPISSWSILILSSHLRLGLPRGLFPVGLGTIHKLRHTNFVIFLPLPPLSQIVTFLRPPPPCVTSHILQFYT